jgi:hypothetical protein
VSTKEAKQGPPTMRILVSGRVALKNITLLLTFKKHIKIILENPKWDLLM